MTVVGRGCAEGERSACRRDLDLGAGVKGERNIYHRDLDLGAGVRRENETPVTGIWIWAWVCEGRMKRLSQGFGFGHRCVKGE